MAKPGQGSTRLPEHDARWGDFISKKRSSYHDTARKMAETTPRLVSGTFILDSRREGDNLGRKERYHCYSLDAAEFEGEDMTDSETPETALMGQFDREHIVEALGSLCILFVRGEEPLRDKKWIP